MAFDVVFIVQHYVLYTDPGDENEHGRKGEGDDEDGSRRPLLGNVVGSESR